MTTAGLTLSQSESGRRWASSRLAGDSGSACMVSCAALTRGGPSAPAPRSRLRPEAPREIMTRSRLAHAKCCIIVSRDSITKIISLYGKRFVSARGDGGGYRVRQNKVTDTPE